MSSQSRPSKELPVISFMKELSGKRIEQRRRRDHISQARLASAIGRSERWVRELEAGGPAPTIEDHVRCAHWLNLSTFHVTAPLLFVERRMPIPYELLAMEDLWDLEEACLTLMSERQNAAKARLTNADHPPGGRPKS